IALPQLHRGIDILLCLDVSSSMTTPMARIGSMTGPSRPASDSRLEVARDAAARFIRGRPDDRIGLLSFARYCDLIGPPTLDHAALLERLADVRAVEADGPEDATAIGAAVARAAQALRSSPSQSKLVIVLTDGEENVFN